MPRLTSEPMPEEERPRRQASRTASNADDRAINRVLRRAAIQSVKEAVVGSWWSIGHTIPAETKAQALAAIERELSGLATDELPRSELMTIAEGIRDRIYRPVIAAQKQALEVEEQQRAKARQRAALITAGVAHGTRILQQSQGLDGWTRFDLAQQVKRALEQEVDGGESEADVRARVAEILNQSLGPIRQARSTTEREQLLAHGLTYAEEQLAQEEDLTAWERSSIARDVKRVLEDEILGDESKSDVEALVDGVLDEMLGEVEEGDEDENPEEEDEDGDE